MRIFKSAYFSLWFFAAIILLLVTLFTPKILNASKVSDNNGTIQTLKFYQSSGILEITTNNEYLWSKNFSAIINSYNPSSKTMKEKVTKLKEALLKIDLAPTVELKLLNYRSLNSILI